MKSLVLIVLLNILLYGGGCRNLGDIVGYWLSPPDSVTGRSSIVKIFKQDGKYFGYKETFLDSLPDLGDINNELPSLRERNILGSVYIYNLSSSDENTYINGRYYDFNIGKTFHLKTKLECDKLTFIISVDNVGMLGSREVYKYLDGNDVQPYIKDYVKPDFSGIQD